MNINENSPFGLIALMVFSSSCKALPEYGSYNVERIYNQFSNDGQVSVFGYLFQDNHIRIYRSRSEAESMSDVNIKVIDPSRSGEMVKNCENRLVKVYGKLGTKFRMFALSDIVKVEDEAGIVCWQKAIE